MPLDCAVDATLTTRDGALVAQHVEQQAGEQKVREVVDEELHLEAFGRERRRAVRIAALLTSTSRREYFALELVGEATNGGRGGEVRDEQVDVGARRWRAASRRAPSMPRASVRLTITTCAPMRGQARRGRLADARTRAGDEHRLSIHPRPCRA